MANEQNLIPFDKRTESEARENGKKGGKASGRKRREQKAYKDLLNALLKSKVPDSELKKFAAAYGVENPDIKTLTLLGMVRASINGNPNAFDRLLELTGEQTEIITDEEQKQSQLLEAIKRAVYDASE